MRGLIRYRGRDVTFHVILNVIAIVIAELIAADIVFCGGFLTFVWYDILKV